MQNIDSVKAHTLKSVQYKGQLRQILLQNENGPCPLLAAANALLLKGTISLPPHAIRANVATIDNVVNMLADHALRSKGAPSGESSTAKGNDGKGDDDTNEEGMLEAEHHIHELLHLFPSLQYGMDVNPKFHAGATGVEYTQNLSAFDLMGVELVHGWLVDPKEDEKVAGAIGTKSYNELMEVIISGNEAGSEIELLQKDIVALETEMEDELRANGSEMKDMTRDTKEQEWVEVSTDHSNDVEDNGDSGIEKGVQDLTVENETKTKKLIRLKAELNEKSNLYTDAMIIKNFLDETSHQLTYTGLHELHNHVQEGTLCVFFRNNHFATLTKTNGTLYMLVTDLGYANVKNVLWEKLDDISGDTEYADEAFVRSSPGDSMMANGPNLSPEQLLAQSSATEADYQLAIQMSQNNESSIDAREGELIAAATAASLQEYNNTNHGNAGTIERTISEVDSSEKESEHKDSENARAIEEAKDRELAIQLHAQYEEERRQSQMQHQQQMERQRNTTSNTRAKDSGCLIC